MKVKFKIALSKKPYVLAILPIHFEPAKFYYTSFHSEIMHEELTSEIGALTSLAILK
jgi:hypothetical protein